MADIVRKLRMRGIYEGRTDDCIFADAADEIERLRAALAFIYLTDKRGIARLCDEHIDRSGRLLGEVREWAKLPPPEAKP